MSTKKSTDAPARDQRPFHICPECKAHNAKFNPTCWRCDHDLSHGAIQPAGILGYRLEQLEAKDRKATT